MGISTHVTPVHCHYVLYSVFYLCDLPVCVQDVLSTDRSLLCVSVHCVCVRHDNCQLINRIPL